MLVGSHHNAAVYLPAYALQIFETLRFWIDVEVWRVKELWVSEREFAGI